MSSSTLPKKYLLTTAEFAASIGRQPKTIRNWRANGLGPRPTHLSPNDVGYDPADIEVWIRALKRTGDVKLVPFAADGDAK